MGISQKYFRPAVIALMAMVIIFGLFWTSGVTLAATNAQVTPPPSTTPPPSQTPAPNVTPPSIYLDKLYIWFLGFVGIAAMFAIVMGGVMYMFAGANLTKTEQAKKWITNAVWGIVLAAVSVLLLRTINPDLVQGFNLEIVIQNAINKVK